MRTVIKTNAATLLVSTSLGCNNSDFSGGFNSGSAKPVRIPSRTMLLNHPPQVSCLKKMLRAHPS